MYPNFIVLGAPRCGTTALYHYFKMHKDVFVNPNEKELKFFLKLRGAKVVFEDYQRYFTAWSGEKAVGDVSPQYLGEYQTLAPLIAQYLPQAKLIISLRNPVDRRYSMYRYMLSTNREAHTFEQYVHDKTRPASYPVYTEFLYADGIESYLKHFDRQQVFFIVFDDLITKPASVLKQLCEFIGVEADPTLDFITPDDPRSNRGDYPRWPLLNRSLAQARIISRKLPFVRRWLKPDWTKYMKLPRRSDYPLLQPSIRAELLDFYRQDILRTSVLIERDLSFWLDQK